MPGFRARAVLPGVDLDVDIQRLAMLLHRRRERLRCITCIYCDGDASPVHQFQQAANLRLPHDRIGDQDVCYPSLIDEDLGFAQFGAGKSDCSGSQLHLGDPRRFVGLAMGAE